MNPNEWIISDDTGISSKTIWAVMMDCVPEEYPWHKFDVPHDPSDFGRCYRLLQKFPEWKARLEEVAAQFTKWIPMVREWDALTALYEEEIQNESKRAPKLYAKMQELVREGRDIASPKTHKAKAGPGITIEWEEII